MLASLFLLPLLPLEPPPRVDPFRDAPALAARIDAFLTTHWQEQKITPAPPLDDSAFLRRLTLDLAGRIPTVAEARAFAEDRRPDRRLLVTRRLLEGPEYALNMGRVLDAMIQDRLAGDTDFVEYLRAAVAEHKPWDRIFQEVLIGPWDNKERKRADRFLSRRQNSIDDLTTDTARAFFGVNVSCAKCHDHPLVADWKQDHYYGMVSFFARTYEAGKGKRNGEVSEKTAEPVMYVTTQGERRSARTMYLSGRVVESTATASTSKDKKPVVGPGKREDLVRVVLEERTFFSRAIANRLWAHFLGRGLVEPVDQLHSANAPSIPGLLEVLAEDVAKQGYDLDRLVAAIVTSRAYALTSRPARGERRVGDGDFARGLLKPLTPHQFALSALLALGEETFDAAKTPELRAKAYRGLEGAASPLLRPGLLDQRGERYQSSTGEALFLSNHADFQRFLTPSGRNLVARLSAIPERKSAVESAIWTVLSRPPEAEERDYLAGWLETQGGDAAKTRGQLIWALLTSAEFRFNH